MTAILFRAARRFSAALASVLVAAALLCATAPSAAGEPPLLREEIKVYADLVTLGDLFENAGAAADAPVFRAPDLGTQGVVAAKRIAAAARKHGLHWGNPGGLVRVSVERPSRLVALSDIRDTIARHAARELGLSRSSDLTVTLDRRAKPFHADPRIGGPVIVRRLTLNETNDRFEAVIGFAQQDYGFRERAYSGRIQETVEVAVPVRAIERGATIQPGDIKTIRLPRGQLRQDMANEAKAMAGMAARRSLPANRPVRLADLERPKLVTRNAVVTIQYEMPGLSLKTLGRALADAAHGETVAVLNIRSKRTIQAVVRSAGVVVVAAPTRAAQLTPARAMRPAPGIAPRSVR